MKDIISFDVSGGLGNMMFMTAAAEWKAYWKGYDLCYRDIHKHFSFLRSFGKWVSHCKEYPIVFKNLDWFKNQDRVKEITKTAKIPFYYEPFDVEAGTHYRGYFQSAKYFDADFARHLFEPSDMVAERLEPYRSLWEEGHACSIHVRRGNYLQLQDKHVVQPMEYYKKAMDIIESEWGVDWYLVFSDDITWCRDNFIGDQFIFIKDTDYIEMFLMSKCTHNIIGNSSFSWWGAFLGDPQDRCVIAPDNWFPHNQPNAADIIPEYWIEI